MRRLRAILKLDEGLGFLDPVSPQNSKASKFLKPLPLGTHALTPSRPTGNDSLKPTPRGPFVFSYVLSRGSHVWLLGLKYMNTHCFPIPDPCPTRPTSQALV